MPLARDRNKVGLGHAIMNRHAKDRREAAHSEHHTTDPGLASQPSWVKLQSVTQEGDLDEFLNTAQLAGTEFTAERRNVTVIQAPSVGQGRHNPYLLTGQQEKEVQQKQRENKQRLRVPRRPAWTSSMTRAQLERQEKDSFLEWRRGLAELQETEGLILTPFERNIEVWRQLWRVVERAHLVIQIVDARNPLRFRCEDLERYVESVGVNAGVGDGEDEGDKEIQKGQGRKRNLLLINKADLLDAGQRKQWAEYFHSQGIRFAFFSAADAAALQAAQAEEAELEGSGFSDVASDEAKSEDEQQEDPVNEKATEANHAGEPGAHADGDMDAVTAATEAVELGNRAAKPLVGAEAAARVEDHSGAAVKQALLQERREGQADAVDAVAKTAATNLDVDADPTRVLNVLELEELFMASAPPLEEFSYNGEVPTKLVVGLVGYPNVGKSSTINALLGAKKVSVSSTPGKTKHFQTIHLSPETLLCDCPGLVFPQFATTAAELVCDGVLPIDQMREYTAPAELVAKRIPRDVIEASYGIRIDTLPEEEGGTGEPTGLEMLQAYAIARGLTRQGQGNPDESRAARHVLKDYVNARLLYAHPPPGTDADAFNAEQRDIARAALAGRKYGPISRVPAHAVNYVPFHGAAVGGIRSPDPGAATEDDPDLDFDGAVDAAAGVTRARAAPQARQGAKSLALDSAFFDSGAASRPSIKGRRAPATSALAGRVAPDGTIIAAPAAGTHRTAEKGGKKHHKAHKRAKQRSGAGYT